MEWPSDIGNFGEGVSYDRISDLLDYFVERYFAAVLFVCAYRGG
jgi:hypothetical protein